MKVKLKHWKQSKHNLFARRRRFSHHATCEHANILIKYLPSTILPMPIVQFYGYNALCLCNLRDYVEYVCLFLRCVSLLVCCCCCNLSAVGACCVHTTAVHCTILMLYCYNYSKLVINLNQTHTLTETHSFFRLNRMFGGIMSNLLQA